MRTRREARSRQRSEHVPGGVGWGVGGGGGWGESMGMTAEHGVIPTLLPPSLPSLARSLPCLIPRHLGARSSKPPLTPPRTQIGTGRDCQLEARSAPQTETNTDITR